MSIVIAIAHKNTVLVESDGRAMDTKTGYVISEKYNKTRRLSNTAICGFTGHYNVCDAAVRKMSQYDRNQLGTLPVFYQAELLRRFSIDVFLLSDSLDFAFVVGGFDQDGVPTLYLWRNKEPVSLHKPSPFADIALVSLDPPDCPCNMPQTLDKYLRRDKMDFRKAVDSCIREVARGCPSVNANIFRELLVR